ncbi:hypothetical protein S83_039586 [Arachis hypogaea]
MPKTEWVVTGDWRKRKDNVTTATSSRGRGVSVKDGEEPTHVTDGGFEIGENFAKVCGKNDGDNTTEDGAALVLANEGESAVKVLGGFSGDAADGALVERGPPGEEAAEVVKRTTGGVE